MQDLTVLLLGLWLIAFPLLLALWAGSESAP